MLSHIYIPYVFLGDHRRVCLALTMFIVFILASWDVRGLVDFFFWLSFDFTQVKFSFSTLRFKLLTFRDLADLW